MIADCGHCINAVTPALFAACQRTAIDKGTGSYRVLHDYLTQYHRHDHIPPEQWAAARNRPA